ncbi:hypothetical protein Arcpr_0229 [Archaeoglobus profundus DSM 5631]|uniref:Uncharacterized protein n=1 Tax=Archaeoglobus profundus (strain DSM 5631 / JCM 9629 / NBRC 100127 / Av18) TaxID=572546 RepID=D2RG75_ARCPA|nr:hypothetical protein Arcpr_0229 [Archaeoglobus profundus DSM 5631]
MDIATLMRAGLGLIVLLLLLSGIRIVKIFRLSRLVGEITNFTKYDF